MGLENLGIEHDEGWYDLSNIEPNDHKMLVHGKNFMALSHQRFDLPAQHLRQRCSRCCNIANDLEHPSYMLHANHRIVWYLCWRMLVHVRKLWQQSSFNLHNSDHRQKQAMAFEMQRVSRPRNCLSISDSFPSTPFLRPATHGHDHNLKLIRTIPRIRVILSTLIIPITVINRITGNETRKPLLIPITHFPIFFTVVDDLTRFSTRLDRWLVPCDILVC